MLSAWGVFLRASLFSPSSQVEKPPTLVSVGLCKCAQLAVCRHRKRRQGSWAGNMCNCAIPLEEISWARSYLGQRGAESKPLSL